MNDVKNEGDREVEIKYKQRNNCPEFSGRQEDYEQWRVRVEDWLLLGGKDDSKYPGIEIRMKLNGRAWNIAKNVDRTKLMGKDGEQVLLLALDEAYKRDTLMDNYGKMSNYMEIQRNKGESIKDYLIRFEAMAQDGNRAIGREMLEGEVKGFHVISRARLTDQQRQMVLSAIGERKMEYDAVTKCMKRIFEGMEELEKNEGWYGKNARYEQGMRGGSDTRRGGTSRGGGSGRKNPLNNYGKVSRCAICRSEYHWARQCPKNIENKEQGEKERKEEEKEGAYNTDNREIYVSGIKSTEEDMWGKIEAIIDTGCGSTVCGEL